MPNVRLVRFDPVCIGCRREAILVKLFDLFNRVRLVETTSIATSERPVADVQSHRDLGWRASWKHSHENHSEKVDANELKIVAETPSDGEVVEAGEQEIGPSIVLVRRKTDSQNPLGDYLVKRGFRLRAAHSIEEGLSLARGQSTDCLVVFGKRSTVEELVDLQNQIAENHDHDTALVIILARAQRGLLSQLRTNDVERVLVQPVSLHDVRTQIESALASRISPRRDTDDVSQPWNPIVVRKA